jgi:hypothetical protein
MSLPFLIEGARTVIPGVYDTFKVQGSLPTAVPAGRSVLILGEASEGVPGALLDLKRNYFTDFESVRDFYRSGTIVDAARELFNKQPSAVFNGAVSRLYVYKTNQSTRASKDVTSPANYGALVAARYGEAGNQIKTQIVTAQAETLPSKTVLYLPSPAARSFRASVSGKVTGSLALSADARAAAFVTALDALTGLSATGGAARTTIAGGPMDTDLSADGDQLTLTRASGTATFDTASIQAGDVCYIPAGSNVAGTGDANSGVYLVVSLTSTTLTLKQLKATNATAEENAQTFDEATGISVAAADLLIDEPVTLEIDESTITGSAASLEISEDSGSKLALGMITRDADLANILTTATSSVANISASVPSAGKLTIQLNAGSWTQIPKTGDLIRIARDSLLAGATKLNAGLLVVESATAQSITCAHLFSGMTTEAVTSVSLNGANDTLKYAASFVSSDIAARKIDSDSERKVQLQATRITDGASLPTTLIGGNVVLELSYYNAAATAATVSIDSQRMMTINLTGSGLTDLTINTKKYKTLQELVDVLNSKSGLSARIPDSRNRQLALSSLDMVTNVAILSNHATPAYNGKIKKDYFDWADFFDANFSLLAFQAGSMSLKAGLPDAEASASFLEGAEIGATSNANVQSGLDDGLKVAARQVIPLFSRDAYLDIEDGLTDTGSSYSIDAINAAVKAHVSTASGTLFKKERFGLVSFDGAFSDSLQKPGELAFERLQVFFQRHEASDANGNLVKFLPWMAACAVAAGRSQSVTGTSMLRKPFLLSSAEHIGNASLYSDTLLQDFDPDDRGQLEAAIEAGLMVFRAVDGFGVRLESPDLSSRSRTNDPEAWVYERVNVLFTCDEVRDSYRTTLENFIGNRTSDVPEALLRSALDDVSNVYLVGVGNGALLAAEVLDVQDLGNQFKVRVKITPAEAVEAIILEVTAERSI